MFTSVNFRAASAYKRVATETSVQGADPHKLVGLLFDGLINAIASARGAMLRGDISGKGVALGKAVRIIEEGLKAGLNHAQGGEIAANLQRLYDYCILRLTQANLKNDQSALEEVTRLIEPVADSWKGIEAQAVTSPSTLATARA